MSYNLVLYIFPIVLTIILETQENYLGSIMLHVLTAAATFMLWLKLLTSMKPYEGKEGIHSYIYSYVVTLMKVLIHDSGVGTYVYIIISIFEHISLFFVSFFVLVFAVGHTM